MRVLRLVMASVAALALVSCVATKGSVDQSSLITSSATVTQKVQLNGVTLQVVEAGPKDGPLVVFVHGWPELSYSWRYQIPALAEAGYHVIAPDMRGYGGSSSPQAVTDFDIQHLTGDIAALVEHFGYEKASIVGHDWGAIVSWNAVLLHPDRFDSIFAMSVPYSPRGAVSPVAAMKKGYGENFFYILYFQEPGVAEAEFDADPKGILKRLYASPGTPRNPPEITDPKRSAGGWIPRFGEPKELPPWLSEADLQHYVDEFSRSGFRGGINYYRNMESNWQSTEALNGAKIDMPVMFLAGEKDSVIRGATEEQLTANLARTANDLRGVHLVPGAGHWVQQEAADVVNSEIISFLNEVHGVK